jgi:hypothetical protein
MGFTETLRLIVAADTGKAVTNINAVGVASDKSLGRSQKTIDKWSRGLTTAGAGMVAFGGAALLGLGKAAMMSEEANLSVVKLENTLANMPRLAGENSKSFIDLAQSIQGKTAADADAIVEGMALLGTFRLTGAEIRKITPLVVDYSRKFGIDMPDAAKQVGKALDGQIGALKRAGVSIDENLFKTDRYAAVTKALRDQVGGFAEEEGKTFAGSLERLKNELGDVAEGVGVGAVDAFTSLFSTVEGGLDKIKSLSPATQEAIGKFATFGSVALIAAGGLSFMIGQTIKAAQNFAIARDAVAGFAGSGGLGMLARTTLVVGGLIALREVLMAMENDLEGIDVSKLENQLLDLAETGKLSAGQLKDVFTDFQDAIESGDPQALERMSDRLGEVDKALAQLASRDPEAAAASFKHITERLREMGASSGQIKAFFDDYAAATANADTSSRTAAGGVDELGGSMGDVADDTTAAQEALQEYLDTLSALFDPLFGATDALLDNHDAQTKVIGAEMELAAAVKEHGAGSLEAAEAQKELTEAQLKAGESALNVKQATAELSAAVADGTVNVADAKSMLNEWVSQGLISASTAAALAKRFDTTAGAARELGRTDPTVTVSERGTASTRQRLRATRDAAHSIPTRRSTTVSASDRASGVLNRVRNAIFGIPSSKTVTITMIQRGVANINPFIGRRQHGGPVEAGKAYVVGEEGPELLLMGERAGHVIPNVGRPAGTGVAMAGGGGTSSVVNIDLRGAVVTNQDEFVRKVAQAVNKGTRLGLVNR